MSPGIPYIRILREKHIVCIVLMALAVFLFRNTQRDRLFTWADAEGYYLYLPALTIYGFRDLPLKSAYQKVEATGRYYDKYTAGVAIMQLPFYALACGYTAIHDDYDVDGFGRPFQRAILLSAIFYVLLGLWILYWFLRKSSSVFVTSATLLCIFLGTNLLYYTYREPGMAHAYSFFLWSALVCTTSRLYSNRGGGGILLLCRW